MPDQKITDLTELASLASGDYFVVVDISDTSMAATGTNKKVVAARVSQNTETYTFLFGQGADPIVGDTAKWRSVSRTHLLKNARVIADTLPAGQPIILDIKRTTNTDLSTGLTSLWSSNAARPQVTTSSKVGTTVTAFDNPSGVANSYYMAEVLQIGSPTAGNTITLELEMELL